MNDHDHDHNHDEAHQCDGCGECENGHGHAAASFDPHAMPHEAAAPAPRFEKPDRGTVVRGIALGTLSVVSFFAAVYSLNRWGQMAAPVGGLFGTIGALSMWATLIHFTGGEKFDDHPWV